MGQGVDRGRLLGVLTGVVTLAGVAAWAGPVGEEVYLRGELEDDAYAAGGLVEVDATALGDVVVAGGQVRVEGRIARDVLAAGGLLEVDARVGDDLRAAGGLVRLSGPVSDDALIAAGRIDLTPDAQVAGRAWLTGGRVQLRGRVGRELRVSAAEVFIDGEVAGDVHVLAGQLAFGPRAVVLGRVHYRSAQAAEIDPRARLLGEVEHTPLAPDRRSLTGWLLSLFVLVYLGLLAPALLVLAAYASPLRAAGATLAAHTGRAALFGVVVVAGTPAVAALLFSTVIGWAAAALLLLAYPLMLYAGVTVVLSQLAERILARLGPSNPGWPARAGLFAVLLALLLVFALIPVLGWILLLATLVLGSGAVKLHVYRLWRAGSAVQSGGPQP
jgi:cytoskeletal protein CcmA (bactofilin family)